MTDISRIRKQPLEADRAASGRAANEIDIAACATISYSSEDPDQQVPSRFVLEFDWRGPRLDEDTWSGSKVNRLIGEFLGQALPSVDFTHRDLT
jgi:hypothetical protein